MPRFVLLEHVGAPDDPAGLHYDLLLEAGEGLCRTWRLAAVPHPAGPPVAVFPLPAHRAAWLDHEAGEVSGGRGFARRIDAGRYEPAVAAAGDPGPVHDIVVTLTGDLLAGRLHLRRDGDRWSGLILGPDPRG